MAGCVGQMDSFDSTVEDWAAYIEGLEQYCVANKIENDKKSSRAVERHGCQNIQFAAQLVGAR